MNFKDPQGQVARWLETLSVYDFTIQHRPGNVHKNADALSRVPCKQCGRSADAVLLGIDVSSKTKEPVGRQEDWIVPWSKEDLREKQNQDQVLSKVITMKTHGEKPRWEEISLEGQALKHYWCNWDHIEVQEGVLYMAWEDPVEKKPKMKLIIPHNLREEVLKQEDLLKPLAEKNIFIVPKRKLFIRFSFWLHPMLHPPTTQLFEHIRVPLLT